MEDFGDGPNGVLACVRYFGVECVSSNMNANPDVIGDQREARLDWDCM